MTLALLPERIDVTVRPISPTNSAPPSAPKYIVRFCLLAKKPSVPTGATAMLLPEIIDCECACDCIGAGAGTICGIGCTIDGNAACGAASCGIGCGGI